MQEEDVPADVLAQLMSEAGSVYGLQALAIGNTALAGELRDLTWAAHQVEANTHVTHKESMDLMRIGKREVNAHRDGIILEGPLMEGLRMTGVMTREKLLDPSSAMFKQGLDIFEAKAASARAFWWMTSAGTSREDELNAGRAYARFNLKATELGIAVHPWSQSLQEYPEMAELYAQVHELIGGGNRVQMLTRLGHAKSVIAAPRRGVEALFET